MDIEKLETEARATAKKHVANMLLRPEQLDKVDQYKKQESRTKASVEAMLKTAMQNQLDGVRTGLSLLENALRDLKETKKNLEEVSVSLKQVPQLQEALREVREEKERHSQYGTAMENLNVIFDLPTNVEKLNQSIANREFLVAHKLLQEMQSSRDNMLYELHRQTKPSLADQNILSAYFVGVDRQTVRLGDAMWEVLSDILDRARSKPEEVVSCLKIIKREEREDAFALQRQKQSGFLAPGRPRKWKERALQEMVNCINKQLETTKLSRREDDKLWLPKYLEVTRQLVLRDLQVVKKDVMLRCPPEWHILETFVGFYRECLDKALKRVLQYGLQDGEHVTFLSWVIKTYPGVDLLQHPDLDLQLDKASLKPLLGPQLHEELLTAYLQGRKKDYSEWIRNTLAKEVEDWHADKVPEVDGNGYYHTQAPIILYQMVDQNVDAAQKISSDAVHRALLLGVEMIAEYGMIYQKAILEFKTTYFKDRSRVSYFTHHLIAVLNNCLHFVELARQMKERYWKPGAHDQEAAKRYSMPFSTFQNLRDEAAGILLEEAFLDLQPHFQHLITRPWLLNNKALEVIIVTLQDYFQDYHYLRPKNYEYVIAEAQNRVAKKYVTAMLQMKMSFKGDAERKAGAKKMQAEVDELKEFFGDASKGIPQSDSPLDIIPSLVEVIRIDDPAYAVLELHVMVPRFPDLVRDHIICLLSLRGDIGKREARQRAVEIIPDASNLPPHAVPTSPSLAARKTLFSQILVSASYFGSAAVADGAGVTSK